MDKINEKAADASIDIAVDLLNKLWSKNVISEYQYLIGIQACLTNSLLLTQIRMMAKHEVRNANSTH